MLSELTGVITVSRSPTIIDVDYNEGNLMLNGVAVTDDNKGNVVVVGATATDDGNGNVSIVLIDDGNLDGGIAENYKLVGRISKHQVLTGVISIGGSISLPKYQGEVEVAPLTDKDIVLKTADTYLDSDITINKIYYAEVSNNTGGLTVTIG